MGRGTTMLVGTWVMAGCVAWAPAPDAPFEEPPRDTPLDTPRHDARRVRDAPTEIDPTWTVPPGVPERCTVERAMHPERLPPLSWESCGEGCTRADLGTTWNTVRAFGWGPTASYELLSDDFGPGTSTDAITHPDGTLLDAWRHVDSADTACIMFRYAAHEDRVAASVMFLADPEGQTIENYFWRYDSSLAPVAAPDVLLSAPYVGNLRTTEEFVVSPALLAARIGAGSIVLSRDGALEEIFPSTATQGGYELGVQGDHLIFLDAGVQHRLMHWTPERGVEALYDPAEPLASLRQAGSTLAWMRLMDFEGGLATRAELWTAELVRDPALFAPRLVNDRVEPDGILGEGMYGWGENLAAGTDAHLIDLDTGRHRILHAPPGTGCEILALSRDEVTLSCTSAGRRSIDRYQPDVHAIDAPVP